jgi:hypothetical protein
MVLAVPDAPAAGISFDIVSLTNATSVSVDQAVLQGLLNDVAAVLSSVIDGNEHVSVHVDVNEAPSGFSYAYAAAGASPATVDPVTGMPTIASANLTISTVFANDIAAHPAATRLYIETLTHEMLHAFGFNSTVNPITYAHSTFDYKFGQLTSFVGDTPYFTGHYAEAINGGPVKLANTTHLANADDPMYPSGPLKYSDVTYFGIDNPTAPLTAVDLGILKDLGYAIKDAFVSADGHTFVAGDGKPGHDQVTGTTGLDTLMVDGQSSSYAIAKTATGFSLTDHVGHGGTEQLANIERIKFADGTVALDIGAGQVGGEAYRLYQAAFNRKPDASGLGYWIDQLDHGTSLDAVAAAFVSSSEFASLYGANLTDSQFVDHVYSNVLHRAPDQAGADFWNNAMHAGLGRIGLLIGFSESAENISAVGSVINNGFAFGPYHA